MQDKSKSGEQQAAEPGMLLFIFVMFIYNSTEVQENKVVFFEANASQTTLPFPLAIFCR